MDYGDDFSDGYESDHVGSFNDQGGDKWKTINMHPQY
jgi:hypothetical protein